MKILHVINSMNIGGAEKLLTLLLPGIKSYGINVDLLLFGKESDSTFFKRIILDNDITIYHTGYGIYDFRNILSIGKLLNNYDLIHVHLFPAQYWTALAKMIFRRNSLIITTEHSTFNRRRKYFLFRYLDKLIYGSYCRIISISHQTQALLLKWLITEETQKYKIIENGIDDAEFLNAEPYERSKISASSAGKIIVLMVARFSHEKDQDSVIKALPYINKNVEVWFVGGGDNDMKDKSLHLAKELNVADKIRFFDQRNDIARIIKTSDMCILSSKWEGFGLVAVEYMAAGKPVIASNVDGLNQVIGNAGLLFETGNYYDLAEKINLILSDSEVYHDLIAKGLNRSKEYSVKKTAYEYFMVYSDLVKL